MAGRGSGQAAQDVHQRALAGTGRSHDRDELAGLDLQADAIQRGNAGIAHPKTFVTSCVSMIVCALIVLRFRRAGADDIAGCKPGFDLGIDQVLETDLHNCR